MMKKIQFTSHMFYLFFRSLCIFLPLVTTYLILFHLQGMLSLGFWNSIVSSSHIENTSDFSLVHRLVILGIHYLPLTVTVMICYKLAKLFRLYEQGDLFEDENIKLIKHIGILMLIGQLVQLIYQPMITAALSFNNPVGHRFASITLGSTNVSTVITALIILIASWIIKEANQLKTEVKFTI
ncbi:Protein of uncharacterised function (DUF2975) [Legionella lansingensis]|uniref:DUF2975 domain-containing protein n=1 Tax=Legionella lansingensis TaxID=45067 RepID=A0A0W0VU15_9GAMM|nr:DUF2975 domain-containing protein [Legionella lansingensis]KTD23534.1 hypothetical protein Llan_0792 [Legionella lansingensis]SNV52025.1 Protein of uncharacterised function (DUF2975) [Legionella lansingensis]